VTLKAGGVTDESGFPFTTIADGKFRGKFSISAGEFYELPKWSLTLSKDGFHDEEVDISPTQQPESGGREGQIEVVAYMRKI
jgi:hypothetical protein